MPEKHILREFQALPLREKIIKSQLRIAEWYEYFDGQVCVSFSGGKDSTVLATLVHEMYPDVPLVFSNTGLEYPEIQAFARKMGAEFVRPKMSFSEVISKYGYPIISKENAEAIYYARRIRNGGGYVKPPNRGVSQTVWQRNNLSGINNGHSEDWKLSGDEATLRAIPDHGGGISEAVIRERVSPGAISRTENGRNKQDTWGGTPQTIRKRTELNGARTFGGGYNALMEQQSGDGQISQTPCLTPECKPHRTIGGGYNRLA